MKLNDHNFEQIWQGWPVFYDEASLQALKIPEFWFYQPITLLYCREAIFIPWCVLSPYISKTVENEALIANNFFEQEKISYIVSKFRLSTTIFRTLGTFQSLTCMFRFLQNLKILSTLIGQLILEWSDLLKPEGQIFSASKNCIKKFSKFYYLLKPESRTHSLTFPLLGWQSWTGYY